MLQLCCQNFGLNFVQQFLNHAARTRDTELPFLHVSQYAAVAGWLLSLFLSYVPWIKIFSISTQVRFKSYIVKLSNTFHVDYEVSRMRLKNIHLWLTNLLAKYLQPADEELHVLHSRARQQTLSVSVLLLQWTQPVQNYADQVDIGGLLSRLPALRAFTHRKTETNAGFRGNRIWNDSRITRSSCWARPWASTGYILHQLERRWNPAGQPTAGHQVKRLLVAINTSPQLNTVSHILQSFTLKGHIMQRRWQERLKRHETPYWTSIQ